jgi:hypothetical protein
VTAAVGYCIDKVGAGEADAGEEENEVSCAVEPMLCSPPKPVLPLVPVAVKAQLLSEFSTHAGPVIQKSESPGAT